jgi:hypothetical protein
MLMMFRETLLHTATIAPQPAANSQDHISRVVTRMVVCPPVVLVVRLRAVHQQRVKYFINRLRIFSVSNPRAERKSQHRFLPMPEAALRLLRACLINTIFPSHLAAHMFVGIGRIRLPSLRVNIGARPRRVRPVGEWIVQFFMCHQHVTSFRPAYAERTACHVSRFMFA